MYIADVLEVVDEEIGDVFVMALLNIAYLPSIINPLIVVETGKKNKREIKSNTWKVPKLCLNTCLYLLIHTFKHLKGSKCGDKLLKLLASCLFVQNSVLP